MFSMLKKIIALKSIIISMDWLCLKPNKQLHVLFEIKLKIKYMTTSNNNSYLFITSLTNFEI